MEVLRALIAAILGLLVASPVCCCAPNSGALIELGEPASCCSGSSAPEPSLPDEDPPSCDCQSVALHDDAALSPSNPDGGQSPDVAQPLSLAAVVLPPVRKIPAPIDRPGRSPSLMVAYSRWLL